MDYVEDFVALFSNQIQILVFLENHLGQQKRVENGDLRWQVFPKNEVNHLEGTCNYHLHYLLQGTNKVYPLHRYDTTTHYTRKCNLNLEWTFNIAVVRY